MATSGLGFKKIVLLVLLEEELGALNGVQRGTLLDLITADEEVQTIVTGLGDVLTDATDVDVIVVGGVERGGETVVRAVINELDFTKWKLNRDDGNTYLVCWGPV